jgi:aspartyl-tRNA(Asn)/glutamyl-tRNA(Gln) amidotransferase subunit A
VREAVDLCEAEVIDAWLGALDRLAGERGEARAGLPAIELVDLGWPGGEEVFAATTAIMFAEAAHGHAARLSRRAHLYGADVRNRLLQGATLDAGTYLRAREVRRALRRRCLAGLAGVDAVVTPTVPVVAPRLDEAADPAVGGRLVAFTRLADVTGLPAISLPIPATALPVGLQLEAVDDATLLRAVWAVARRLQR